MVDSYLDRLPERLVHLGKGRIQGLLPDQDRSLVVVQLVIELGQGPLPVPGYTVKDGPDALRNGTFGLFANYQGKMGRMDFAFRLNAVYLYDFTPDNQTISGRLRGNITPIVWVLCVSKPRASALGR